MKPSFLMFVFLFAVPALTAQTSTKPTTARSASSSAAVPALPPGVPRVRGLVKTAFSLRYQDIKPGTGAVAEPNKVYKVLYTGYLAADGRKFDASEDHRPPLRDKDGKPVLGEDGKPKLGDPQPIGFVQGFGRVIPGFDQGFAGMKVGGKRRLFIPWQLAYGFRGHPGPDPAHPGIPPKADLIFDIELVDVSDMQLPTRPIPRPVRPGMAVPPGHPPTPQGAPAGAPPSGGQPAAPGSNPTAPAPGTPAPPQAQPKPN